MSFKAVTIAALLAVTSLDSPAITLGKVRGAAWIGQSLDVIVPVQLEGASAEKGICAEVDVFHADSRQDSGRIRITTEPSSDGDLVNVRIVSTTPVDEPVVTLYVRAGCNPKVSRRYVFLADMPDVSNASSNRSVALAAPQVPTVIVTDSAPVGGASAASGGIASNTQPEAVVRTESVKAPAPRKSSSAVAAKSAPRPKPPPSDRPRLKLDPMDGLFGRIKPPVETERPATADTPPELREGESLSQLQASIKAQLAQSAKSEAQLLAIRDRLEKAESERVPVALVYALVSLLVLCFGGFAFLAWKRFSHRE